MKKMGLMVAALVMMMAFTAAAQDLKIAVIDYAYCMRNSAAGKKATDEIRALTESRNQSLKALADEIQKMNNDFQTKEKLLTDAAKREEFAKIQNKVAEYEQKARQVQAELQAKDQELTAVTMEELDKVLNAYAKEKGLDLILQIQGTAFVGAKVNNISDEIIARFDKVYPGK